MNDFHEKVSETAIFNFTPKETARMTVAVLDGRMEHYECDRCGKYAKSFNETEVIINNWNRKNRYAPTLCPACELKFENDHKGFFTTKPRTVPNEPKPPWGDQFK